MKNELTRRREGYFREVTELTGKLPVNLLIVTHLLPDREELFVALRLVANVAAIVAIPYSIDAYTLELLRAQGNKVLTPNMSELKNTIYLIEIAKVASNGVPLIIIEIGGYFAHLTSTLRAELSENFVGIVEDTEAGHREYEREQLLSCPVISVARSPLKAAEDNLIGLSCVLSAEMLLRKHSLLLRTMKTLVMGFGKVGKGLCHALEPIAMAVSVYDRIPERRILALTDGFAIPDRAVAIADADIVFGATGQESVGEADLNTLKNGAILVSCSSKQVEFESVINSTRFQLRIVDDNVQEVRVGHKSVFLFANGQPVNFLSGAEVGPVLALIQAETIVAIRAVLEKQRLQFSGLAQVDVSLQRRLAELWIQYFVNASSGLYE